MNADERIKEETAKMPFTLDHAELMIFRSGFYAGQNFEMDKLIAQLKEKLNAA